MKNKMGIIGLLLAGTLTVSNLGIGLQVVKAETLKETAQEIKNTENVDMLKNEESINTTLTMEEMEEVLELEDLPEEDRSIISEAVSIAEESGEAAGEVLNELEEGSEAIDLGIKEVLDTYYRAKSVDEKAVEEFSETVEADIEEKIEDYKEAREERDNEENLDYAVDEEIITFHKNTSKEDIDTIVRYVSDSYEILLGNEFELDTSLSERKQKRLETLENYEGNIVVRVNLDLDQTVAGAVEEFEGYDCVVEAAADEKYDENGLTTQLKDEYADLQWYLDRCDFRAAWDSVSTAGCEDIWVAIVDTGCRVSHNDLAGGIVSKYAVDVTQKDSSGNYIKLADLKKPYDSEHGTCCTGIIAAKANSVGIAGAARGWSNTSCKAIPIKISSGLTDAGKEIIYTSNMCLGIEKAIDSGAEVISISLSSASPTVYQEEVIARAKAAGVVVVAAAGNYNSSDKRYPAALDYVISVGGTNKTASNKKASFSSYGSWVNIVAPATDYVSTSIDSNTAYSFSINGTSFATPLVASAIGLMLAINPNLSVEQIKNILSSTVTDINSSYFECGLLNTGLAVQKAKYQEFKNSTVTLTSAAALSNNRIKLKWNDLNVYGPEKVIIYRAVSENGTYSKIKTLSGDDILSCSYTDSGLTSGKIYYYKIRVAMKYGSGYKYTPYSEIKFAKVEK